MDQIRDQVKTWIEWARANLSLQEDIPKITSKELDLPWLDNPAKLAHRLAGDREKLLDSMASLLVSEPTDIHTRFVILTLYAAFAGLSTSGFQDELVTAYAEEFGLDDTEIEMGRSGDFGEYAPIIEQCETNARNSTRAFNKELVTLVGILKWEDVPPEWPFIRWEVLNSYAIRKWDRALELYNRAEKSKALEPATVWVLRGQFRYLVVFGNEIEIELDSLEWEPSIYGKEHPECALVLLHSGLRPRSPGRPFEQTDQIWLRHTVTDLENAFGADPPPPDYYRAPLARCLGLIGRARDAAVQYESLLYSEIIAGTPVLKRLAYDAAASAYQDSGDHRKAVKILDAWAKDFPSEKGIYIRLSEVLAKSADFDAIPPILREEISRDPELDRDWKISTLLALGETRDVSERMLKELKSNPELFDQVGNLVGEYWPPLLMLTNEARERWVLGTYLTHFTLPKGRLGRIQLREAAGAYAKAVEAELREKVFVRFREVVRASPELLAVARGGLFEPDSKIFSDFLLHQEAPLALGQMLYALNPQKSAEKQIFMWFREWSQQNYVNLTSQLPSLDKINKFRRAEAHARDSVVGPEEIPALSRKVVESLSG